MFYEIEVRRLCRPYHGPKFLLLQPLLDLLASVFRVIVLLEDDIRGVHPSKFEDKGQHPSYH